MILFVFWHLKQPGFVLVLLLPGIPVFDVEQLLHQVGRGGRASEGEGHLGCVGGWEVALRCCSAGCVLRQRVSEALPAAKPAGAHEDAPLHSTFSIASYDAEEAQPRHRRRSASAAAACSPDAPADGERQR